jgi:hypothetical protein
MEDCLGSEFSERDLDCFDVKIHHILMINNKDIDA